MLRSSRHIVRVTIASLIAVSGAAAQSTIHVSAACGNDAWTGQSDVCAAPNGPKRTIGAAIAIAVTGDTVLVADGSYSGAGNRNLNFAGRDIIVMSSGGPGMCIIDCGLAGRAFVLNSGETAAAVIEGFAIVAGKPPAGSLDPRGGGIAIMPPAFGQPAPSPTIRHCIFVDCDTGVFNGGAMFIGNLSTTLVERCRFIDNTSGGGSAVQTESATPGFIACEFLGNTAGVGGAILLSSGSAPTFINCLFADNVGTNPGGGAIYCNAGSNPTIINCTFVNNSGNGGAIYSSRSSVPTVIGSILYGNSPNQIFVDASGGQPDVSYSNIEGGWPGTGNLADDPNLVDPSGGDFRLASGSPCIDAADNTALPAFITTDLDGNPRFLDDPTMPNVGIPGGTGGNAIADMGCYESQTPGCYADCDTTTGQGVLDIFDFLCFGNRFAANDPYACDCDTSTGLGVCDIFDFLCFGNAFSAGCP